jgi:hypothetical protein
MLKTSLPKKTNMHAALSVKVFRRLYPKDYQDFILVQKSLLTKRAFSRHPGTQHNDIQHSAIFLAQILAFD